MPNPTTNQQPSESLSAWTPQPHGRVRIQAGLRLLLAALSLAGMTGITNAAEPVTLSEPPGDERAFRVVSQAEIKGELRAAADEKQAVGLKLQVNASLRFSTRRLPPAGRDSEAYREARFFEQAVARILVNDQSTESHLRDTRRLIVADGTPSGVRCYSPAGALHPAEVDLINTPGDHLPCLGLLPGNAVKVGDTWKPDSWVIQTLTGTEAVLKSQLECRLATVADGQARIEFHGEMDGATLGAATKLTVKGTMYFNMAENYISRIETQQEEERVVGAVSPGMKVSAKVTVERTPSATPRQLAGGVIEAIPLTPSAADLNQTMETPWGFQLAFGRDWHLYHQTERVASMRMLDRGNLIAQCNVSPIPAAEAGESIPLPQFEKDIRSALGERLQSIESSDRIRLPDGSIMLRVIAAGRVNEADMYWRYYLRAAPDGRQVSFLFAVEKSVLDLLGEDDRRLVDNVAFPPIRPASRSATGR